MPVPELHLDLAAGGFPLGILSAAAISSGLGFLPPFDAMAFSTAVFSPRIACAMRYEAWTG